jgi:hypothetical protein
MLIIGMRTNLPKLTNLTRNLEDEIDRAVRRTAFKLQQKAVERLTKTVYAHNNEPTPTGALRASIYTRTWRSDNYRDKTDKALSLRAQRDGAERVLDQVAPSAPKPAKGEAWVGVGMAYGVHIEYPTRGRPGTYFMAGARSDVARYFQDQIKAAIIAAGQGDVIPDNWDNMVDDFVNSMRTS